MFLSSQSFIDILRLPARAFYIPGGNSESKHPHLSEKLIVISPTKD